MKYKIEIWQWRSIADTYESDNVKDVVDWYKTNWQGLYESGNCSFIVYECGRELSFEETFELGFYE